MSNVKFNINSSSILLVGSGLILYYSYAKNKEKFINSINPNSQDNIVFKTTEKIVGEKQLANVANFIFGGIDLIRDAVPFIPDPPDHRINFAKQIYGIE